MGRGDDDSLIWQEPARDREPIMGPPRQGIGAADEQGQVRELGGHGPDPTCWQVTYLTLKILAVATVLGLAVGMIIGWGSVVVVQVK